MGLNALNKGENMDCEQISILDQMSCIRCSDCKNQHTIDCDPSRIVTDTFCRSWDYSHQGINSFGYDWNNNGVCINGKDVVEHGDKKKGYTISIAQDHKGLYSCGWDYWRPSEGGGCAPSLYGQCETELEAIEKAKIQMGFRSEI